MHWEDSDKIKRIITLITRRVLNTATPEEEAELDAWRREDPRNDALCRDLLAHGVLEQEFRRRDAVDVSRPLADMEARVRRLHRMPFYRRAWFRYGAAAVVAGLVCGLTWWLRPSADEEQRMAVAIEQAADSLIHHGCTRALLTSADGEPIALGSDEAKNRAAIRARADRQIASAKMNNLVVPRGGEFKIELEDGTQVWLNAASTLHYPDTFATDERRVRVEGEAYFKVARNEQKPFYVETAGQLIRVYGTEFNVNAYPDEDAVRTTLVEGSIALQRMGGPEAELVLTPGHQAVFDKESEVTSVRSVDTEAVTGWRRGVFVFDEQNLEQIMRSLSRWYDFDFRFEDDRLRSLVFMGSMPRYGAFSEVLEVLSKSCDLRFRLEGRLLYIDSGTMN